MRGRRTGSGRAARKQQQGGELSVQIKVAKLPQGFLRASWEAV